MPVLKAAGLQWTLRFWSTAATIFFLGVFIGLGFWQINRAHQKERIIAAQNRAARAEPVDLGKWLAAGKPLSALYEHHVRVRGHALTARALLQDAQVLDSRVGYHVWLPVKLKALPRIILINRGWIPQDVGRSEPRDLPDLETKGPFTGVLLKLPRAGIHPAGTQCRETGWPHVVLYPRVVNLQCLFRKSLLPGLVQLDVGSPGYLAGLKTGVPGKGLSPMRHYGYAFQWFAMGTVLLLIYLCLNFRRDQPGDSR